MGVGEPGGLSEAMKENRPFWIPTGLAVRAYGSAGPRPKRTHLSRRGIPTKQSAYRDRLHAQGRCTRCARPAAPFFDCAKCRRQQRQRYYQIRHLPANARVIEASVPQNMTAKTKIPAVLPGSPTACVGTARGPCGYVLTTDAARQRGRCDDCWQEVAGHAA